jgi:hypothetical protein
MNDGTVENLKVIRQAKVNDLIHRRTNTHWKLIAAASAVVYAIPVLWAILILDWNPWVEDVGVSWLLCYWPPLLPARSGAVTTTTSTTSSFRTSMKRRSGSEALDENEKGGRVRKGRRPPTYPVTLFGSIT